MNRADRLQRQALAQSLRSNREQIAVVVTEAFLVRHPDWLARHGDAARTRGIEDALFHVDFLAGAVQAGSIAAFENYARWTAGVLGSRGIAAHFLSENLEQVGSEFASILDDSGAATVLNYVRAARFALEGSDLAVGHLHTDGHGPELSVYLDAALGGHRTAALNVALEMLRNGSTVPQVYTELLQEAQYEIGRRWERNEISVSTEHMATAITQFVLAQLYSRLEVPQETRGNALVTGVEGELHQLGANMVADILEADGWNVRFLGTQIPHRDILAAIDSHQPQLVGISTTMLFNIPNVARLVEQVRKATGSALNIVVGGGAFRSHGELWQEIGADALGRDLQHTLTTVNGLLPRAE